MGRRHVVLIRHGAQETSSIVTVGVPPEMTSRAQSKSSEHSENEPSNASKSPATARPQRAILPRMIILGLASLLLSRVLAVQSLRNARHLQALESDFLRPFATDEYAICRHDESVHKSLARNQTSSAFSIQNGIDYLSEMLTGATSAPRPGIIHSFKEDPTEAVDCLIIKHGRIAHSGNADSVRRWCETLNSPCDVRQVPPGYSIQPSFTDAHGHLLALGQSILSVDLTGATSLKECIERLNTFIESNPTLLNDPDRWIEGNGWDQTRWNDTDGKSFPTAQDLAVSPLLANRRISLKRIDFHALWMSPRAIKDIEANGKLSRSPPKDGSEEVPGGLVVRDEINGRPTGILIDNAMQLALDIIPPWTDENRQEYLQKARELLFSLGITGVGDAAASLEDVSFYLRADEQQSLGLRVYAFVACPTGNPYCGKALEARLIEDGIDTRLPSKNEDASRKLTVRTIKIFADGALGSWGSAMWEPYDDKPSEHGMLLLDEAEIPKIMQYWHERGWQLATHAIGDRANSIVLDSYQNLLSTATSKAEADQMRPRIEHAQLIRPLDLPRFAQHHIYPSMQPTHCTSDFYYISDRIGKKRSSHGAYAWASLFKSGARLIFGSDFPVESPNVLEGIWAAISRLDRNGNSPFGKGMPWHREETVDMSTALKAFTINPAYGQFQEKVLGSLEVGKWADFILVKGDLLDDRLKDPRDVQIVGTAVAGQWVWQSNRQS
ncbi:unnamed protein product [Sympodiomycopsis kandeliae]